MAKKNIKRFQPVPDPFLMVNKVFWDHLGGGRPPGPFLTSPGEWLGVEGGTGTKNEVKNPNLPKLIVDSK